MNDQEARDYHRAMHEAYDNKVKSVDLNRELDSYKSENQKLKDQIALMKKAGTLSEAQQIEELLAILEGRWPNERVTEQRKQITALHRKVKRLEGEEFDGMASRSALLHELAQEIRDEFPDLNPLASIFKPYLGEEIARFIERY